MDNTLRRLKRLLFGGMYIYSSFFHFRFSVPLSRCLLFFSRPVSSRHKNPKTRTPKTLTKNPQDLMKTAQFSTTMLKFPIYPSGLQNLLGQIYRMELFKLSILWRIYVHRYRRDVRVQIRFILGISNFTFGYLQDLIFSNGKSGEESEVAVEKMLMKTPKSDVECIATLLAKPFGTFDETWGDNIVCRLVHVVLTQVRPEVWDTFTFSVHCHLLHFIG